MEDEVVFIEPVVVRLDQGRAGALDLLLDDFLRKTGEIRVPDPAAGDADKRVPVAGERELEDYAEHAVVVILDLSVEAFATFENQRLNALDHRRTLVLDVSWSRVLEAGLLAPCAENVAKSI